MRIEILQAGTGDSIWIRHNKKNIVIDGGKSTTAIRTRYYQMPMDEIIDLLVVTHIDSDHIAGIIALIKHMKEKGETHRLKQVWFNFPKNEKTDEYSVDDIVSLDLNPAAYGLSFPSVTFASGITFNTISLLP